MDDEIVMRVARLLCFLSGCETVDLSWGDWIGDARHVIMVMHEPTSEMVNAGRPHAGVSASSAERTWKAMIERAVSSDPRVAIREIQVAALGSDRFRDGMTNIATKVDTEVRDG